MIGNRLRPFQLAYNALYTEQGKRNLVYRLRRARLGVTPFRRGAAVTYDLRDGRRFVVHPNDHLSMSIYLDGFYEQFETQFISTILQSGDVTNGARMYRKSLCYFDAGGWLNGTSGALDPCLRLPHRLLYTKGT